MKDAQKPDHVSLNTVITRLKEGRFVIPDFQREFEWRPWGISELMRSIFLDYYIGSFLLWTGKRENFAALSCEPVYGNKSNGNEEYIVLDGQQRLTAMLYAFLAPDVPLPNRTRRAFYFIKVDHFMAEEYDQAFGYDWYTRHWTVVLNKREAQFASHLFPLSVIGAGGWDLYSWVQGYEQFWNAKAAQARTSGDAEAFQQTSTHAANARDFGGTYEELRSNIRFPISNSIRILQSTRFATSSRRSTAAASDLMYSISSTLSSSQRASS